MPSGEIELTEEEASVLIYGQVPLFQGKPDPIGGAEIREKKAREDAEAAAAKAAAEKAEYEEFVAFRAAKAARKETVACTRMRGASVSGEPRPRGPVRYQPVLTAEYHRNPGRSFQMSASATYTTLFTFRLDRRQLVRRIRVDITGLASGANTIPHGIVAPNNQSVGQTPKEEARSAHFERSRASHASGRRDQSCITPSIPEAGRRSSVYVTV